MGQDSEEAAEFVVTVRNEHAKMKEWYTNSKSAAVASLKETYGSYPSMWKEVLNWPGWKETRKEYLKEDQLQESVGANNGSGGAGVDALGNTDSTQVKQEPAAAPRKRKSRWGSTATSATASDDGGMVAASKRFAPSPNSVAPSAVPNPYQPQPPQQQHKPRVLLPSILGGNPNLTPQQQEELKNMQAQLRAVNERLDNLEKEAARIDALPRGHRERSPSPPPIYGADGKRKNTRAVRWRERLTAERQDLLESIMRLSNKGSGGPGLGGLPGGATTLLVRKRVKKIRIPVEEHPNYNFIGLIIGPRGKTQKELEAKTGCKIAIRGRGSVKEGARGRRDGKVMEGDNEPLHVVISGDDQRAVDAASDMVEQMLVVIDDEKNVHKQQQLRELALLNGTLKEGEVFCQICAEKGHRSFECPKRFANKGSGGIAVKCAICGDSSHPTRDCPQRTAPKTEGMPGLDAAAGPSQQVMDSDYLSFMAELDGKKIEPKNDIKAQAAPATEGNDPASGMPPIPASDVGLPLPPRPPGLPPPPMGGPPLPPNAAPPANFHRPSQQPATPQQQNRPSAQQQNYYGHYQPQHGGNQQPGGYGGQFNQQYSYGQQNHYQQYGQQQQQYNQQQQQPQANAGDETAGWDPSGYYGGGAGGFNWWDQ